MPGPRSRLPVSSRQTRRGERLPVISIYSQICLGFAFSATGCCGAGAAGCGCAVAGACAIIIAARNIIDTTHLPGFGRRLKAYKFQWVNRRLSKRSSFARRVDEGADDAPNRLHFARRPPRLGKDGAERVL